MIVADPWYTPTKCELFTVGFSHQSILKTSFLATSGSGYVPSYGECLQ